MDKILGKNTDLTIEKTEVKHPIIAIATAPGQGAIGVIRLSDGLSKTSQMPALFQTILSQVFQRRDLLPRYAHFGQFFDEDQQVLDEGLVIYFPAPHSYTGESVLEFQGHGGIAVLQRLLSVCLTLGEPFGLKMARAGEFTERAFLNHKIDLLKAESIADLIQAESLQAAKSAAISLSGVFSNRLRNFQQTLIDLRLLVEATLDFPEEEIDFLEKSQASSRLNQVLIDLTDILAQSRQGALLQHGISVVLVGSPNVGKSTLMNALAREEVSIVSPIAGTTRDYLRQQIHLNGIPFRLIDTAGLRQTQDEIEMLGIERTWREIEKADMILHICDASKLNESSLMTDASDSALLKQIEQRWLLAHPEQHNVPTIRVWNKADQLSPEAYQQFKTTNPDHENTWFISAKLGDGISALEKALLKQIGFEQGRETPLMARERHIQSIQKTLKHLHQAQVNLLKGTNLEILAEDLRLAHQHLGEILGEFSADDLLGEIFGRFCIGK